MSSRSCRVVGSRLEGPMMLALTRFTHGNVLGRMAVIDRGCVSIGHTSTGALCSIQYIIERYVECIILTFLTTDLKMLLFVVTATSIRYETSAPLMRFFIDGGRFCAERKRNSWSSYPDKETGEFGGQVQHSSVSGIWVAVRGMNICHYCTQTWTYLKIEIEAMIPKREFDMLLL